MSERPPHDGADLADRLPAVAGAPVLVVGDVMLDRYVEGTVERVSPEAPIPVLRIERELTRLGGAGNVVANLAALGAQASFVGVVGDDAAGEEATSRLQEAAPGARVLVTEGRPTTVKQRYIAGGQQLLRADREHAEPLPESSVESLVAAARVAMEGAAAVVLSDYAKGVLPPLAVERLIAAAREAGTPVVVDPKGRDFAAYRGASLVTPNRRELAEATGLPTGSDDEIAVAARRLLEDVGIERILVTRGPQGMTLVESAGGVRYLPAEVREVFDVSGAGDTVVATLAAALAGGLEPAAAARLANAAAGVVVGKVGTAVVRPDELLRALHAARLQEAEAKIVDRAALLERVAAWRRAGFAVGFTNGCFDLLHPGHVSLLRQARAACDRLIVALNSDASVARLKGDGRPVQDEAARAAVLASLATVDLVVIFPEDTPLDLIDALRPDVLVKGADYGRDEVVGADAVERHGGRVLLAELAPGHSTSATLRRLAGGR